MATKQKKDITVPQAEYSTQPEDVVPQLHHKDQRWAIILGLFICLVSVAVVSFEVGRRQSLESEAGSNHATVSIRPDVKLLMRESVFKVWVTADNPMAFVHTEVEFDPAIVRLTENPTISTDKFTNVLKLSSASDANASGVIVIAVGLDPESNSQPPSGAFELASLKFEPVNPSVRLESAIGPAEGDTQVMNPNSAIFTIDRQASLIRIRGAGQLTPTPSTMVTPTPSQMVTPTATPNKTPTPTPNNQTGGYWRGDAESGDISQWCSAFREAVDRIQVVSSPVKQGSFAYRFNLQPHDNPTGERATLSQICKPTEKSGEEKYYGMSVMLPTDFPNYTSWSQVMQFKANDTGSPPVQITYRDGNWQLTHRPNVQSDNIVKWTTPARKGMWDSFVFHIKWSPDPQVGLIELWFNGNKVSSFNTSTIHVMDGVTYPNFVAIGHYRDASINDDVVLYHDGFVVGPTFASVAQ